MIMEAETSRTSGENLMRRSSLSQTVDLFRKGDKQCWWISSLPGKRNRAIVEGKRKSMFPRKVLRGRRGGVRAEPLVFMLKMKLDSPKRESARRITRACSANNRTEIFFAFAEKTHIQRAGSLLARNDERNATYVNDVKRPLGSHDATS
jgi:hypothetical protein